MALRPQVLAMMMVGGNADKSSGSTGGGGPDALLTAEQVAQVRAQAVAAALRKPKTAADQVGDPNHAAARFCLPP